MATDEDETFRKWKRVAPALYDWMANNHLVWPALACRFGPVMQKDTAKSKQTIYISEQTAKDDKTPNKLVVHSVNIPEPLHAPIDHVSSWKENQKSPYFSKQPEKTINHPGECNKIRDVPGYDHIVITHSDVPELYVWDLESQPDHHLQKKDKYKINSPDLKLVGHTDDAPFALATSNASPSVCSGGDDKQICIWNLADGDNLSTLMDRSTADGRGGTLEARLILKGHSQTVTDVCFKPGTDHIVASAADDHVIMTWDARTKSSTSQVKAAHGDSDILCLDWSPHNDFVASGDAFGNLYVWDVRMLVDSSAAPTPLFDFGPHPTSRDSSNILTLDWSPFRKGWLASGGDDGRVSFWDLERPTMEEVDGLPSQLVLQHMGHLGNIMDLQFSPSEENLVMSVSNDGQTFKEGGAVQLWRMSTMITNDASAIQSELEMYQKWLESGRLDDLKPAMMMMTDAAKAPAATPAATQEAPADASAPSDAPMASEAGASHVVTAVTTAEPADAAPDAEAEAPAAAGAADAAAADEDDDAAPAKKQRSDAPDADAPAADDADTDGAAPMEQD